MKKRDLAVLAAIGMSAGAIVAGCTTNVSIDTKGGDEENDKPADEQAGTTMESFKSTLSPEAKKKFDELDAKHKMMSVEMSNQECNGKNKCAGMGGCGTHKNSCAGKNSCKGEGGAPVKSPNDAVDVQHKAQHGS